LYGTYRDARKSLQRAITRAKTQAWQELLETLERDPWGRPYWIVRNKLRSWAPPVSEGFLSPQLLEEVVTTLFPPDGGEGPPGSQMEEPSRDGARRSARGDDGGVGCSRLIHGGKENCLRSERHTWPRLGLERLRDRLRWLFDECLRRRGRFPRIWKFSDSC